MDESLITLVLGGIIAILASVVTYYVNSVLRLKEESISREFTMRTEARDFFQGLYGSISRLTDYVRSSMEPEDDKILMLSDKGYKEASSKEIINAYKKAYKESSKTWSSAVKEGFEIFLPPELAKRLAAFWALSSYLYAHDSWEGLEEYLSVFVVLSEKTMDLIEESLGLKRRKILKKPKWLNWKSIRSSIRGSEVGGTKE